MADVENKLWWYQCLHTRTLKWINKLSISKNSLIIDAGCGTGGFMLKLKEAGYTHISGFDISDDALIYCKNLNLDINKGSLLDIENLYPKNIAKCIICHDVLYFLNTEEQQAFLAKAFSVLKSDGYLILNLPAFRAFSGIHDKAVGIGTRFTKKSIQYQISVNPNLLLTSLDCWPFFLSPLIFFTRTFQRLKLKLKPDTEIVSDVEIPSNLINKTLKIITNLEFNLPFRKPFGSSIFVVLKKKG